MDHRSGLAWLVLLALVGCVSESTAPAPLDEPLDPEDAHDGCAEVDGRVVCNHGHSINFRSENLRERRLFLESRGLGADHSLLMASDRDGSLGTEMPDPLPLVLRAHLGDEVKLRVVSFGGQAHTFHVHGHLWLDATGKPTDNEDLLPAEALEASFVAGGGPERGSPERSGPGDWLYHCHVEGHVTSGMWSLLRVMEAGDPDEAHLDGGRFPGQTPAPLGGDGQLADVWVVAIDAPLSLTRVYSDVTGSLRLVTRSAWVYLPVTEQEFADADAGALRGRVVGDSFQPWILSVLLGTRVRVHLKNLIVGDDGGDVAVSLHPHGVVYGVGDDGGTPGSIAHRRGEVVDYEYVADTAGTWAYHDHADPQLNVARGLFAAIVVTTAEEQAALARDYTLLLTDLDANWLNGTDSGTGSHEGH
jgi:hypothetical protein